MEAFSTELLSREEKIDILVNNAGATWGADLDEFPESGWDKVMDLNVKSVCFLTQKLLPALRASGSVGDPARVVNIASINGITHPQMNNYSYSASKSAVIQLTRHLAAEMAPHGVRANAILPGFIDTPMARDITEKKVDDPATIDWDALDRQRAERIPLGRVGTPWDVANAAVFLASDEASYITGTEITVDGGVSCRV